MKNALGCFGVSTQTVTGELPPSRDALCRLCRLSFDNNMYAKWEVFDSNVDWNVALKKITWKKKSSRIIKAYGVLKKNLNKTLPRAEKNWTPAANYRNSWKPIFPEIFMAWVIFVKNVRVSCRILSQFNFSVCLVKTWTTCSSKFKSCSATEL